MAFRRILEIGDEKLRKTAKPVTKFDSRLRTLLDDMAETMYKAEGAGLAAPQVGILRRALVFDMGEGLVEMVNPEIVAAEGEECAEEACLSIPGRKAMVTRPRKITVLAQNSAGETVQIAGEEHMARVICHEIDHLDGILYVDKMDRETSFDEETEEEGTH